MTPQNNIQITPDRLLPEVEACRKDGLRLVQICAVVNETEGQRSVELNYSFDKNYEFRNYKLSVPEGSALPSISGHYLCAFLYENEIKEHFGLDITGIAVDFKGTLYKTAVKVPFCPPKKAIPEKN